MRTDWSKRAKPAEYLNMQEDGAHSPGPDAEVVPWLIKERDVHGFGTESVGTDAGQAHHLNPPYPCHYFMHGNNRWRPAVPDQPGPVAAHRRGDLLGAAQDPQRLGQPAAGAGAGAARLSGRQEQQNTGGFTMTQTNVAIVTGGSAGIGAEICRSMLDAGYEVISMARRAADFSHPRLHNVQVDLLDADATAQAGAEIAARFPVSHVIHNAGVIWPNLLPQVTQEELHGLTQIHLGAAISLVQAALPGMQERHFGRIVMMSSRGALGLPTRTAYSATKAGMVGMARTWSLELAPYGITVNVVAPGPIQTDMFYEVIEPGSEREKQLANGIPVKRLGRSDDVARAVMFFADPANSFVTGQTLFVCGGASVSSITI